MHTLITELGALWRARRLLGVMVRREFQSRHAGSVGGVAWLYLQPLLTIAAYFLVFDVVFSMRMGSGAPAQRVGTYLIVGMVPWMVFSESVQRAMSSLVESAGLLQKNPLPPSIFPARAVAVTALVFLPLLLILVVAYWPQHRGGVGVLAILPLAALQLLLSFLIGYLCAILAAALRDVLQIVGFLLSVGVFLSPILFPLNLFPADWRWVLWLNPMTAPVLGYQSALLQGAWPPMAVWLALLAWIAVAALLLDRVLRRARDQMVDWL